MLILIEEWMEAIPRFTMVHPEELEFHVGIWDLNSLPLNWG